MTLGCWVSLPENRAARAAMERVVDCVCSHASARTHNPLFLHGPAGSGKTHLLNDLIAEATRRVPELSVSLLSAGDFEAFLHPESPGTDLAAARQAQLVAVEDLQH